MFNGQMRTQLEFWGYKSTPETPQPRHNYQDDFGLAFRLGLERAVELIDASSSLAEARAQIKLESDYPNRQGECHECDHCH